MSQSKINERIATEIMGEPKPDYPDPETMHSSRIGISQLKNWYHPRDGRGWVASPFSEGIEAAMLVVKRLAEANVWTEIQVRGHGARPLVRMGVPSFQWDRYADSVDELPAAICAAALHKDALESIAGLRMIEAKGK